MAASAEPIHATSWARPDRISERVIPDPAPASNADLGKTIASILGLKTKDKGKLIGRVLTEAMPNGAMVGYRPLVMKSAPDQNGLVTILKYQTVGPTHYFDVAGYPGPHTGLGLTLAFALTAGVEARVDDIAIAQPSRSRLSV